MNTDFIEIYNAGIKSVTPNNLIYSNLKVEDGVLSIDDFSFSLSKDKIWVIGAGKASALMAQAIENLLTDSIAGGCVIVKYNHTCELNKIKLIEAGHPTPDQNGVNGTNIIKEIVQKADKNDLIICLWSGGGSSLLADVPEGLTLEDIVYLNELLLRRGATINEINAVRKHLSLVKGGQLAQLASPTPILNLLLSDVIGDLPDVIASGPATADPTTFENAIWVLEKYQLIDEASPSIISYLKEGIEGIHAETNKAHDAVFEHVHEYIIGNNAIALQAAAQKAEELGYKTIVLSESMQGDDMEATEFIIQTAIDFKIENPDNQLCLIMGGETTVTVNGDGIGGRNQHSALFAAMLLQNKPGIVFLSAGTDGTDGPTDAAGAWVDHSTLDKAISMGIDPLKAFRDCDSYPFFQKVGGQLITGPTFTNVMDLKIVLVH